MRAASEIAHSPDKFALPGYERMLNYVRMEDMPAWGLFSSIPIPI
jgi:hypothetical protein